MTSAVTEGVPAALAAAIFYNAAPVLQATAARREEPGHRVGLGLVTRLARRRVWLAGLGCEIAGFVLEAVALTVAPLALVQPVIALGMVLLLFGGSRILHERLGRAAIFAAIAMVVGVIVIVLSIGDQSTIEQPADAHDLIVVSIVTGVSAIAGWVAGAAGGRSFGPLALAVAAGACYGTASVFTRQVGLEVANDGVGHLFVTAAPYLLAAASILAIALLQRTLQSGRAVVAWPAVEATSDVCAIVIGLALLGERLAGGLRTIGFALGLALIVGGLFVGGTQGAARIAHG